MTHTQFKAASRIHVTYGNGGRPDLHAARDAFVAEVSAPGGLTDLRSGAVGTIAQCETVEEAVSEARERFDEIAAAVTGGTHEGYLYRHDVLPVGEVWTFFTSHGVGDDEAGDYFYLLVDALGFDSVRVALVGTGGVVSSDA